MPAGGRVYLLAMEGDRAVLFELKLGNAAPPPQLERYARMFQDPILIGVTEKALPGALCRPHVTYYTYHSLNDLVLEHLRERQLRMPGGDLTQLRELVLSCYSC